MTVLENDSLFIDHNPDSLTLEITYKNIEPGRDFVFWQNECQQIKIIAKKYRAERLLVDTRLFTMPIEPYMQDWFNREIAPTLFRWVKRFTYIVNPDVLVQISIQQTMEDNQMPFESKPFDSLTEARQWLSK